jgi:hypothetical protein
MGGDAGMSQDYAKIIGLSSANDHGAFIGLGDDDHTIYVHEDARRDITGTQRIEGGVIVGDAGDSQLRFVEEANGWSIHAGNNSNVFTKRMEFNTSNHVNAHDIMFYDGDGTTIRALWDESGNRWVFNPALFARETSSATQGEIFPKYTLLDNDQAGSTTAPSTVDTDLVTDTVTLDYSGQPVIVMAWGLMTTTVLGENERFECFVEIDGTAGPRAYEGQGSSTFLSHTHDFSGSSGESVGHSHSAGSYTTASNNSGSINVGDTRSSCTAMSYRSFTPAGSSFNIKLRGLRSGTLGSWDHELYWIVWRG